MYATPGHGIERSVILREESFPEVDNLWIDDAVFTKPWRTVKHSSNKPNIRALARNRCSGDKYTSHCLDFMM